MGAQRPPYLELRMGPPLLSRACVPELDYASMIRSAMIDTVVYEQDGARTSSRLSNEIVSVDPIPTARSAFE